MKQAVMLVMITRNISELECMKPQLMHNKCTTIPYLCSHSHTHTQTHKIRVCLPWFIFTHGWRLNDKPTVMQSWLIARSQCCTTAKNQIALYANDLSSTDHHQSWKTCCGIPIQERWGWTWVGIIQQDFLGVDCYWCCFSIIGVATKRPDTYY